MSQAQQNIAIVISAANRTEKEFGRIVTDLKSVERQTGKVINAQHRFGKASSAAGREASQALQGVADRAGVVGRTLSALGPGGIALGAAAAGFALLSGAVWKGTMALDEWDRRMRRTQALLKSTGGAAGMTAFEIEEFAKARDLATLGDKDEILDAVNALQTFRSVSGETFRETIRLSQDLSSVFGTGLRSQVVQLGKALEDPVKGLTALRRVGVMFTKEQEELIRTLVESGDKLQAQQEILAEIEKQVGGASEAEAGGLAGAMDTLSFRWRAFLETIGNTDSAKAGVDLLAASLDNLTKSVQRATGQLPLEDQIEELRAKIAKGREQGYVNPPGGAGGLIGPVGLATESRLAQWEAQLAELEARMRKRTEAAEQAAAAVSRRSAESSGAAEAPAPKGTSDQPVRQSARQYEAQKLRVREAFAKKFRELRLSESERERLEIREQSEAYIKAGADRLKVREWEAAELERIDARAAEKTEAARRKELAAARKAAEQARRQEEEKGRIREAFAERYADLTQTGFERERAAIRTLAADYTAAGAEEIRVREWAAAEIARINGEEAEHLLRSSEKWQAGAKRGLQDYAEAARNAAEQTRQAFSTAFASLGTELNSFVWDQKANLGDMVESFGRSLTQMLINTQIMSPLAESIGGFFGGLFPNRHGNAFDLNGLVPFARGGLPGIPTFFPMPGGRVGVMNETPRQEAIMPLTRMPNGDLGIQASLRDGGGTFVIIHNHSGEKARTREKQGPGGTKTVEVMIGEAVAKDVRRGGAAARAMNETYGARRQGVTV